MTDHILAFWENQAQEHGTTHWASWGDNFALQLEIENIAKFIKEGDDILDVGCANGYASLKHLGLNPRSITGIDFSEKMIAQAKLASRELDTDCAVTFEWGDIRSIQKESESFDLVYTTRVLINLPTWEEQMQGINECLRVCRPGGIVLLSEAFWEPLVLLNAMRSLKGLSPLVEHDFNRYLKQSYLEDFLANKKLKFNAIDFSSVYYLGSRFLRELVTNPDYYPGYSNPINEAFFNLEQEYSGGGFGIQMAYAIFKE